MVHAVRPRATAQRAMATASDGSSRRSKASKTTSYSEFVERLNERLPHLKKNDVKEALDLTFDEIKEMVRPE